MGVAMKTDDRLRNPDTLLGWLNTDISPNHSYLGKATKASRERISALINAITHAGGLLRAATDYQRDYWLNPPKAVKRAEEN
jgi:hypothetical protein